MTSEIKIPFGATRPTSKDIQAVMMVLRSGHIRMGAVCRELERTVAEVVDSRYAIAMSSCTAALHASLLMLGVHRKEVILPSLTFAATANAVVQAGGIPKFADIESKTLTIDCRHVEQLVTSNTAAIIPVHLFGIPCNMTHLCKIAQRHKVPVVEDCAYGLGCKWRGKSVGNIGEVGCFSFHVLKNITTGEGGIVTTNKASFAKWLREFRNYGMHISKNRQKSHFYPGLNCKITDIQAALGLSQIRRLPKILEKKERIAAWYTERLRVKEDIFVPRPAALGVWNHTFYVIKLLREDLTANKVSLRMLEEGVETQVFKPVHLEPWYQKHYQPKFGTLPTTESVSKSLLALPAHLHMAEPHVDQVVRVIRKAMRS